MPRESTLGDFLRVDADRAAAVVLVRKPSAVREATAADGQPVLGAALVTLMVKVTVCLETVARALRSAAAAVAWHAPVQGMAHDRLGYDDGRSP